MRLLSLLFLFLLPLTGCPSASDDDDSSATDDDDAANDDDAADDDDSMDDDDATGDDDDATGDDDDATGDDDDATGDDDDATGDDDDATGDDDDATGDDDDATGDDDDSADDDDTLGPDDDDSAGGGDDDDSADDDDATGDDDDSAVGPCGIDGFSIDLEVADAAGNVGTSFATTDALTFTATVTNNCPFEVEFTTDSACLFDNWSLAGTSSGTGMVCLTVLTNWTIAQGGTLSQVEQVGTLSADTWTWSLDFEGGQSASQQITVQ